MLRRVRATGMTQTFESRPARSLSTGAASRHACWATSVSAGPSCDDSTCVYVSVACHSTSSLNAYAFLGLSRYMKMSTQ